MNRHDGRRSPATSPQMRTTIHGFVACRERASAGRSLRTKFTTAANIWHPMRPRSTFGHRTCGARAEATRPHGSAFAGRSRVSPLRLTSLRSQAMARLRIAGSRVHRARRAGQGKGTASYGRDRSPTPCHGGNRLRSAANGIRCTRSRASGRSPFPVDRTPERHVPITDGRRGLRAPGTSSPPAPRRPALAGHAAPGVQVLPAPGDITVIPFQPG